MFAIRHIKRNARGFTLIEVLLVVAIIAILVGIVILAVNPSKQLGDTHNSQRRADVATILNAAYQYSLDNNTIPAKITSTPTEICATGAANCNGLIDLAILTSSEKYLVLIPKDPQCSQTCARNGTGYLISKDTKNHITVSAKTTENGVTSISASR